MNLADAAGKLKAVAERFKDKEAATPVEVVKAVVEAAEVMLEEDIAANKVWGLVLGQCGEAWASRQ